MSPLASLSASLPFACSVLVGSPHCPVSALSSGNGVKSSSAGGTAVVTNCLLFFIRCIKSFDGGLPCSGCLGRVRHVVLLPLFSSQFSLSTDHLVRMWQEEVRLRAKETALPQLLGTFATLREYVMSTNWVHFGTRSRQQVRILLPLRGRKLPSPHGLVKGVTRGILCFCGHCLCHFVRFVKVPSPCVPIRFVGPRGRDLHRERFPL